MENQVKRSQKLTLNPKTEAPALKNRRCSTVLCSSWNCNQYFSSTMRFLFNVFSQASGVELPVWVSASTTSMQTGTSGWMKSPEDESSSGSSQRFSWNSVEVLLSVCVLWCVSECSRCVLNPALQQCLYHPGCPSCFVCDPVFV